MTKILSCIAFFLVVATSILSVLYLEQKHKITALQTQNNAFKGNINYLEAEIEKRNEKAVATYIAMRELEETAEREKNKSNFNWYCNIASDSVIIKLKEKK